MFRIAQRAGIASHWRVKENIRLFEKVCSVPTSLTVSGLDLLAGNILNNRNLYREQSVCYHWMNPHPYLRQEQKERLFHLDSLCGYYSGIKNRIRTTKYEKGVWKDHYTDTVAYNGFIAVLKSIQQEYARLALSLDRPVTVEEKIMYQVIKNRAVAVYSLFDENYIAIARDSMVAQNLRYYADSVFPDKKIIVWAHDIPIAKSALKSGGIKSSIGAFLSPDFKERCYAISLKYSEYENNDSVNKKAGLFHKYTIEHNLEKLGDAFFIDVGAARAAKLLNKKFRHAYWWPHLRYPYGGKYPIEEVFDAVIYIRRVHKPVYVLPHDIEFYRDKP